MIEPYIEKDWKYFDIKKDTEDFSVKELEEALKEYLNNIYSYKLIKDNKIIVNRNFKELLTTEGNGWIPLNNP